MRSKDDSAPRSIEMLKEAGLNFEQHRSRGIDTGLFGEHMFTAGRVANEGRIGAK